MQDDGCSGGVVSVWESTGWGHGRTPCAQAAGRLLRRQHRAGQPGLVGETKCMTPSVGTSDTGSWMRSRRSLRYGVVLDLLAVNGCMYNARGSAPPKAGEL